MTSASSATPGATSAAAPVQQFSATALQAARAIVSIFETGAKAGNPAACAVLKDGAGISYGIHQATHKSGSLAAVLNRYIRLGGAHHEAIARIVPRLAPPTPLKINQLAGDASVKDLLKRAGADPVMRQAQEEIFGERYMEPAIATCAKRGWQQPLSLAVIYDSLIQGGLQHTFKRIKVNACWGEQEWVRAYVNARRDFQLASSKPVVRTTVYRPDAFLALIEAGQWELRPPFQVRGVTITAEDLA